MTTQELLALAGEIGFDHYSEVNVPALEFRTEVRDMCAADRCHNYGRNWTCPPHCGTLEEVSSRAKTYHRGLLLQSTAQMEDDFDVESMQDTEILQKKRFTALLDRLRDLFPNFLPMATGGCTLCPSCSCPDAPCRFPDRAVPSMEAYGLVVSDVCKQSGLPYYYGPQTITYTSCILID